jgi:hypothetical protein
MKSWKTALAGLLTLLPQVLHLLFPTKLTIDQATAISAFFAGGGLYAAKDANVTGVGDSAKTAKEIKEETTE